MTLGVATLAGYQLWLRARVRRDPGRSVHALSRQARGVWVETMMADPANGVLAVQTLRNSVMASTLMASTSVLLIIGALSALTDLSRLSAAWHALNPGGELWQQGPLVKILDLLISLFLSFFFFAMAVRSYNHVGYLIAVPRQRDIAGLSPPMAADAPN